MSLLLKQPSFRVPKPVLVRSSPLFSTSLPQTLPCQIICVDPCRLNLGKFVNTDSKGITDVPPWDKQGSKFVQELGVIGTTNGWEVSICGDEVELDELPYRGQKTITLPPLVTLPRCQTQMITNAAMSSSSPEEDECVVALKFLGPQLSFCMPALSRPKWINVRIKNPSFFSSRVMFSKKDEMFRIVGSGGHLIGSWDLRGEHYTSKFRKLQFHNLPKLTTNTKKRELLDSCLTSEHLVESRSTGEIFMVKWYKKTSETIKGIEIMETKALMVFKLDEEEGTAVYTQDIGDLVIFLTKSESFCAPASSVPEMRRNCVQIWDVEETTIVDLAAQEWNC